VGAGDKVIVHVKDIGQQGLGGLLFKVKLLHLVLHHDGLSGDLLPWSGHSKDPRNPLKKQCSHPAWHLVGVRLSVVVVEDHDGGHHRARHHEHDAVKIRP